MAAYCFPVIQCEQTGMRLRAIRKKRGIKVAAVCDFMGGISEQAVYKWERGASLPTVDNLLALSHLYHVQMEELLVYEEAEMASSFFAFKERMTEYFTLLCENIQNCFYDAGITGILIKNMESGSVVWN